MNKIYKVVWSKVKNCYVVVSELAKNVISGSVKSAKVGTAPMVKGMALGALMAFMITGNAWAADVKLGYEHTDMENMPSSYEVSTFWGSETVDVSFVASKVNPIISTVNAMGGVVDLLDDNMTFVSGESTTVTTTLTVNGLTTLSAGLNVTGSVTASDFVVGETSFNTVAAQVSTNTTAISSMDAAYKAADSALSGKIDTNATNISTNTSAIAAEKTAREDADTTLSKRITNNSIVIGNGQYASTNYIKIGDSLTVAAGNLDAQVKVNADAIATETTRATNVEDAISSRVTTIEGDYLKAADKTELSTAINAEKERAEKAEAGLQTSINTNASAIAANTAKVANITTDGDTTSVSGKLTTNRFSVVPTEGKGTVSIGNVHDNANDSDRTMIYSFDGSEGGKGLIFGIDASTGNISTQGSLIVANGGFVVDTVGNAIVSGDVSIGGGNVHLSKDGLIKAGRLEAVDVVGTTDVYAGTGEDQVSLKATAQGVVSNETAIGAIKADYLKAADKEELQTSITTNATSITANTNAISEMDVAYKAADTALNNELKKYVDDKTTGIASEVNLAEVQKKTQNIVLGDGETEAGKTVIKGDVNIVADTVNNTAGNLTVAGNVQAATFNGINLQESLDSKANNENVSALEAKTAGISRTQYSSTIYTTGTGETKVTDDFVVDTQEGKGKVTIGYMGENEMLFTQNEAGTFTFGVNAQTGAMQANGGAEFGYIGTVDGNKVYNVEMNAEGVAIKSGFSAVDGKVEVKAADDESALINVNKGTANQVVIGATGITVGLNSTHMDDAGVYAGGHNYTAAYAAIMEDGRIKGANGAFTVDASGNVIGGTYNGVNVVETANQVAINKDNIKTNADNIATNSTKIEQNANDIARVEREYKEADVALKSGYETADATLKSEVTDAYTQADATLKSEVTDAYTQADATLKSEVADAYTQADATLKSEVTDAYTQADTALKTEVTDAYTQADATLKSEVTDAYTQADATLKSEVEQGYKAADAKLQKDIAANTEAISGLNDRVTTNESDIAQNAADIAANKTAIESNTKLIEDMDAAYKAADKALQENIDAEKAAREAADAQTLTDAKAYADQKDAALNDKISDVEAGYKEADKALENKIADVADAYVAADEALKEEVEAGYKAEDAKLQTQVNEVKQQAALNDRVNQVQNTQIAQLQSENIAQNNAIADLEKTKADKTYVDEVKEEVEAGYKAADEALKAEVTEAYTKADEALKAEVTEAYTKADEEIKADVKANTEAIEANATAIGNVQEQADANSNAINGLNQRLGKMNGKINKVGAGAAALAALHPLDYDPDDKLTFSAGVGNYAGENAAALGAFYRPDEKLMFSLGGTMGNGENMVNLGVSIGLDGAKGAPKLSRKEMIEKVSTVEAENKNLKAENEALAERVARLERIVVALTEKEQTKEK